MATKLKNMKLTSVDLVRAGANQEADICLFKSADHVEAAEEPSEDEKNIFKRFLDWIRKNATEAENEPQSHAEKQEESIDSLKDLYKSALAQSLDSIQKDDHLTDEEKKSMAEMSREQYNRKLKELHDLEEEEDRLEHEVGDDHHEDPKAEIKEELIEEIDDDDDRYDEIDEIPLHKFNQNHGADGKFSSSGGGGPKATGVYTLNSPAMKTAMAASGSRKFLESLSPENQKVVATAVTRVVNGEKGDSATLTFGAGNQKQVRIVQGDYNVFDKQNYCDVESRDSSSSVWTSSHVPSKEAGKFTTIAMRELGYNGGPITSKEGATKKSASVDETVGGVTALD